MSYVILSDLHCHDWTLFNKPTPDGVNGRLQIILNELLRAATYCKKMGSKTMVFAGDTLHVRGHINPEVLNPLQDAIRRVLDMGIDILAIPGNHDLAGKETDALGNAIKTLADTQSKGGKFVVIDEPTVRCADIHHLAFVPWRSKIEDLLVDLETLSKRPDAGLLDVFIHAGIDGVLANMPPSGKLTPEMLAAFGFRSVFAGHYHNFKEFAGRVFSIGATTHHNWGDVGTKAGFLSVADNSDVAYHSTHAPKFIDVSGMTPDDMELAADGNYVRFSGSDMTQTELDDLRRFFEKASAKGVSILAPKKAAATRRVGAPKAGASLDDSVTAFVDANPDIPTYVDRAKVKSDCADILALVRSVAEDAE